MKIENELVLKRFHESVSSKNIEAKEELYYRMNVLNYMNCFVLICYCRNYFKTSYFLVIIIDVSCQIF